jgi:flagellar hook assembly protein FlgD
MLEEQVGLPGTFALSQNYPNPFNSATVIRFALPTSKDVELAIFNLAGQQVASLVQGMREAGTYTISWDGRDDNGRALASGVYLYRLQAGNGQEVETRKLLLLR